jgi:hypothetical protein
LQLGQSQQGTQPGASQTAHPLWTEGRGLEGKLANRGKVFES